MPLLPPSMEYCCYCYIAQVMSLASSETATYTAVITQEFSATQHDTWVARVPASTLVHWTKPEASKQPQSCKAQQQAQQQRGARSVSQQRTFYALSF